MINNAADPIGEQKGRANPRDVRAEAGYNRLTAF